MVRPEGASGPVSQSTSAFAILPVNLAATPKEGSKALRYEVAWGTGQRIANDGSQPVTINLLRQYQSGQFTAIQSVWIDNINNYFAVDLIAVETGERVRCPPLTQGMFPLMSAVAPVFTLVNEITGLSGLMLTFAGRTQLQLLNTKEPYFLNPAPATFKGGAGFATASASDTTLVPLINNPFSLSAPRYMRLTGFRLFVSEASTVASATAGLVRIFSINEIAGPIFEGFFNIGPSSGTIVFDSGQVTFPEPVMPPSADNVFSIQFGVFGGPFPVGGFGAFLSYNFDIISIG